MVHRSIIFVVYKIKLYFFSELDFFALKGTVHPKMSILSSFTRHQVVPNLYECVCSEHKGKYFEECGKQYISPTVEVNGATKQTFFRISLCSEQTLSYRFGTT